MAPPSQRFLLPWNNRQTCGESNPVTRRSHFSRLLSQYHHPCQP
jgi:hypothetical protein